MPAPRAFARPAAVVLAAGLAATLAAQPPDPPKGEKAAPKGATVRLPDGTLLWTGPAPAEGGDRVWITPQDLQKLSDQADGLRKQLAARKPAAPSGCAVRGRVEKRGEASVAVLKAVLTFRTATPNAAVALGGKGAFPVGATLDGDKRPALEASDDGFVAVVESAGDHTLALDLECPVGPRAGAAGEVGFDLGLPRAAITTLALDPPAGGARVSLTVRDPAPAGKAAAEPRRVPGLDPAQLAPRADGGGYPLGPAEAVEVVWEPPAAAPPADAARSAEVDVTVLLTEGTVETTAKVRPRGAGRFWKLATPAGATVTADRAAGATRTPGGSAEVAVVGQPADPTKPVWTVELPAGATPADWVFTATHRTQRPAATDPAHRGPFPVGPVAALDTVRQTGVVKLSAPSNTRLVVTHGPELRQVEPTTPADPTEAVTAYRLAAGPAGAGYPAGPLLTVEARPLAGAVEVRPAYQLALTDGGWRVRAELKVVPVRREVDSLRVDLPADWRGPGVSPPELVDGVQPVPAEGGRQGLLVRLAAGHRGPLTLTLTATAPASAGGPVLFPRFPDAAQRDAAVTVAVPEGLEVRGTGREWDGDKPGEWDQPLAPGSGPDGKPAKPATGLQGKFERGPARLDLSWGPARPELAAEVRADVIVHAGQVVVAEVVRLRAADGFGRAVRFRGPPDLVGLQAQPPLTPAGPGEWSVAVPPDGKEAAVTLRYAVPVPSRPADGAGPWRVPVGLVWPAGATRTESEVRVWSRLPPGHAVGAEPGGWRELPPAPAADRDALPARTLAGSAADLPLTLVIEEGAGGAAAVWVDRGLVQTWAADDGAAAYRARFRLARWLTDAAEVGLPDGLAGPVEARLDGKVVEAVPATDGRRYVRVPLPEPAPGRTVVLDLRYRVRTDDLGEDARAGVAWPRAAFAGPVRWQVAGPGGTVPVVLGGRADFRWRLRGGLPVPAATGAGDGLERWFNGEGGADAGTGPAEEAAVWLSGPEEVRVVHLPHLALVTGCSLAALLIGLAVARLPAGAIGSAVALVGGMVGVAAVLAPQPTAQAAGAAAPGVLVFGLVLAARAWARWYHERRVTHLPGFARGRSAPAEQPAAVPSSARGRPSANGSTGPHDAAPVPATTGS